MVGENESTRTVTLVDEVWMGNRSDVQKCISRLTASCHLCLEVRASEDMETIVLSSGRRKIKTFVKGKKSAGNAWVASQPERIYKALRGFEMLRRARSRRAFSSRPWLVICNVSQIRQHHFGAPSLEPVKCVVSQKALPIALALNSLYVHLHLCFQGSHGVPCVTRVLLDHGPCASFNAYNTACVQSQALTRIANCIPSYRTRLHWVPKMLVTESEKT
jgi:hypothetical protein